MKLIFALFTILTLSGCASKSIHEICSDPGTLAKYKNYDQCYAEQTNDRADWQRRKAAAGAAFNQSINKPSTTCHSQPDGFGGFKSVCN